MKNNESVYMFYWIYGMYTQLFFFILFHIISLSFTYQMSYSIHMTNHWSSFIQQSKFME